jgi:hypothetical protein
MPREEESDEQLRVQFVMHVSGQQAPPSRAENANAENTISRVDVLAFKVTGDGQAESYDYLASATDVTGAADEYTRQFSVRLLKSDDNYRFVLLANLPDGERQRLYQLAGRGLEKDEVLSSILYTHPGKWTASGSSTGKFTPLPMWAETGVTRVDDDLAAKGIPGVSLTRALAKFEISVATEEARDVFAVEKVYLYNRASRGKVVPVKEKLYATPPVASMPDDDDPANNPLVIRGPLEFDVPPASAHAFTREIYAFETGAPANPAASLDATCLVVGGTYGKGGERSYYRLDLKDQQGNYRDVLRNHAYAFNIIKVSGPGYSTPEQAFRSAPVNIEAEIVEWDEGNVPNVLFDGQHILALSHASFEFFRDEQVDDEEINRLVVYTDYQTSNPGESGWKAGAIAYGDASNGTGWLRLSRASGVANTETGLYLYLDKNETGAPRSCSFQIEAGRLKFRVAVEQLERAAIGITIVDEERKPIDQIVFTAYNGKKPEKRTFTVQWRPREEQPTVLVTDIGVAGLAPGNGQPVPGPLAAGGSVEFTVAPEAIKPAGGASPFIERATQYTFSISVGGQRVVKNLLLQHVNRATVTDLAGKVFLLDGTTQSFNVKANFPWKIELVEDASGLLASGFTTQYGGNNTGKGDQVSFKLKDFISAYNESNPLDGTITLRLSQKNEKNQYEEVDTYKLECFAAVPHGNANSYMVTPGGVPILIPLTQVQRAMTATYFGITSPWITNFSKLRVEVLWQDVNVSFDAKNSVAWKVRLLGTSLDDGKILLHPGTQKGNAGVALYEGDVIKWSWHIWNTDYNPGDGTSYNPIKSPAASSRNSVPGGFVYRFNGATNNTDYVWMDRNLGSSATTTAELMYQWGRKDPFPGATKLSTSSKSSARTWYCRPGVKYEAVANPATEAFNLANSVRNPLTRYMAPDWFNGKQSTTPSSELLWGRTIENDIARISFVDGETGKSVFDPCPEGWTVPPGIKGKKEPWPLNLTTTTTGDYPFTSALNSSGTQYPEAYYGYYWMATPSESEITPKPSYYMSYGTPTETKVGYNAGDRGNAQAVRCIKEK